MKPLTTLAVICLLALSCATAPPTSSSSSLVLPLWAGLAPGEHTVGFRTSHLGTEPHPLQISVWYPSDRTGTPLKYSDYLLLNLTEARPDEPTAAEKAKAIADAQNFLTTNGVSATAAQSLFNAPMYARRDARPLPSRRFPLVFIVQGNEQSAAGQAVLAEFLASHGYVVATIPSITRITGPMTSDSEVGAKAEAEAVDIDRAVSALGEWPNVVNTPITLVGHSFGARSALFYAMHHPTRGLVSLEGGIGLLAGQKAMLDSKMLDLGAQMPPILHFYELNDARVIPDFHLLRSLHTPDLEIVRMNDLRHVHFSSDGFAAAMLPEMATVTKAGPDFKKDVLATAQQTLQFIDKQWANHRPNP
jgi:dienelactone hydrolase